MSTFSQAAAAAKNYGSTSKVSAAPTRNESSKTTASRTTEAAAKGKSGISGTGSTGRPTGSSVTKDTSRVPSAVAGVRSSLGLGAKTSPETQRARLNMMKAADKTNLPGMLGPGGMAGTQKKSSAREQDAAAGLMATQVANRYGMKFSEAKDFVTKAARTISGEAAGETDNAQSVIAKTMFNRMDLGRTMKNPDGQYNATTDVLKAYDANGMRPGTQMNAQYQKTVPGTEDFARGMMAIAQANIPGAIAPSLSKFTHYRAENIPKPGWETGANFSIGNHVFSNPEFSRGRVGLATAELDKLRGIDDMAGFSPSPVQTVSAKKYSDRVPGATAEPAVYRPDMVGLPGEIQAPVRMVRSPMASQGATFTSPEIADAYTRGMIGLLQSQRPAPAEFETRHIGAGPSAAEFETRHIGAGPYSSNPFAATTSPMAGQGLSWPVSGRESMFPTWDDPEDVQQTVSDYAIIADKLRAGTEDPAAPASEDPYQKIAQPFQAVDNFVRPKMEKINELFGGSPYNDLYGRPSIGREERNSADRYRNPNQQTASLDPGPWDFRTLLRRYFNG